MVRRKMSKLLKTLDFVALMLAIVACVNWFMFGILGTDLVTFVWDNIVFAKFVYTIIGLAGAYLVYATIRWTISRR